MRRKEKGERGALTATNETYSTLHTHPDPPDPTLVHPNERRGSAAMVEKNSIASRDS
jgi:hypothetical protein